MLGRAARSFVAHDARWAADVALSSALRDDTRGVIALTMFGHTSRIVYEGSIALRSQNPHVGVPGLTALLPAAGSEVTTRARHAAKLLDDTKKSQNMLLAEMKAYFGAHHDHFTGNAVWFARALETDLGLCRVNGRLIGATIPLQFRLGTPASISIADLGPILYTVSQEQGSVLAVLAAAAGDATPPAPSDVLRTLPRVSTRNRKSATYLARRFQPMPNIESKLLLLMLESEIGVALELLGHTETGHQEAVFRARMVAAYHVLSGIRDLADSIPDRPAGIHRLLAVPAVDRMLTDPGLRKLRNRCMHYEIRETNLSLDPAAPLFGLTEALCGMGFDELRAVVIEVMERTRDALSAW